MCINKKILFALCLIAGTWACSQPSSKEEVTEAVRPESNGIFLTSKQLDMAGVEIGRAEYRPMHNYLECTGKIEVPPQNRASIHSPTKGFIKEVRFLEGEYVKKGTVLAVLSHPDLIRLQRELMESKNQLDWLAQELSRKETLAQNDAIARKEWEKTIFEHKSEKARYEGVRAELSLIGLSVDKIEAGEIQRLLYLKAPVNGYITAIHTHMGELVDPGKPLYEMVDPGHIHLELEVFAKDAISVRRGEVLECWVPGLDERYSAKVHMVGREINQATKTVRVHGHFDKEPGHLLPGTYVQAQITTSSDSVWALPQSAVALENGAAVVFVQKGEYFEMVEITTGRQDGEYVAVELPPEIKDKLLVVKGAYYLKGAATGGDEE